MQYEEFTAKVSELGISKADFLRHLDMAVTSMSHWSAKGEIPHVVGLYLNLLLQVKQLKGNLITVIDECLPKGEL